MKRPVVLVLGPKREEGGSVAASLALLFSSALDHEFRLAHFRVADCGARRLLQPLLLAATILFRGAAIAHFNTTARGRAAWRDLALLAVAKLCGARVVYQLPGGGPPQRLFRGNRLVTGLLRFTLRLPDVIVVPAQIDLRTYRKFVPRQPVVVIPQCIDRKPYATTRVRTHTGGALRLLYCGKLARDRGLFETLQALKLAHAAGTPANLVIAGSGPDEAALRQLARALGLIGRVAFIGAAYGDKKVKLLSESDALVFAAHGGPMPRVLLEGMAAGATVIATRVGAAPDVIIDGVHGLFVSPHNPLAIAQAVQRLAGNRELLARFGEACRRRIAGSYSTTRLADELGRLYAELCDRRSVKVLTRS